MNKIQFTGIMPALTTPYDKDEKFNEKAMRQLVQRNLKGGVHGFYVCGATGEGPVLPIKTRFEALETVIDEAKGKGKIIAHIGGPNFNDVKALVAHAEKAGADAISSLAPNAYYVHTNAEIVDYYKRIASLTSLPLLVYVTPFMLGADLEWIFNELISVDNILGCKFTLPNYYLLSRIKMINNGNINVINGPDEMLLAGLSMGADGGIGSTYNIIPDKYVALFNTFKAGDITKAREIQYQINKVVYALISGNKTIECIKEVLTMMGIDMGYGAYPCAPLTTEERNKLIDDLRVAGIEL